MRARGHLGLRWATLAAALALSAPALGAAPQAASGGAAARPMLPFTKSTLPNGLRVILHEDHTTPTVVVNLGYRVGSRFEAPRRTGFAHLFEHLMFMGTRRAPTKAFDAWMEAAGGWNNAWTSEDRTVYYDVGPPTALPLLLWLEADRLSDLGPSMTLEKLNAQRDVVRNERRQTSENQPYGKAELRLPELLFPEGHPYHHPVIGSHADLEPASVEDVKALFATHYTASNAALVVAGDHDPAKTLALVTRLFGALPRAPRAVDPGVPGTAPALASVVRETLRDTVELARVTFAWPSPRHFAPGDAELDLLGSVLSATKASRLTERLVFREKVAQKVVAYQASGALASHFAIDVLVTPGVDPARVERLVDEELAKVRAGALTDGELGRAKNGLETGLITRLQSVRERASLLSAYEEELGDPGYFERDLARYRGATLAALRSAATGTLRPDARVVLTVLPEPAPGAAAKGAP